MAAINFQQTDTANDSGVVAGCSGASIVATTAGREIIDGGSAGSSEVTIDAGNDQFGVIGMVFETDVGGGPEPNVTPWQAGDYVPRLNVTAARNGAIWVATYICERESGGAFNTVASLTGQSISLGTTGVKSMTVNRGSEFVPDSASSTLYIVCLFDSPEHGGSSFGITPDQLIDTPIDDGAAQSASGAAALAAVSAAGTAKKRLPASGSAELAAAVAAGVASKHAAASGGATLAAATASGTAEIPSGESASGAATLAPATASGTAALANVDLAHYRWSDDDNASHELTTLLGSEDTSFEIPQADLGTGFNLIVKLHNDGDRTETGNFQCQYNKDGGGWFDINAASSNVRVFNGQDTNAAEGVPERLTATPETFQVSVYNDLNALITRNIPAGQDFEFYYCMEFRAADNSGGEAYQFRILSGSRLLTQDFVPAATIASGGQSASGAATLTEAIASGNAKKRIPASGAATAAASTASGTAKKRIAASADATLAPLTAAGTAQTHKRASGGAELVPATAAGVAARRVAASGDATLDPVFGSGVASLPGANPTASGAATLTPATASGTSKKRLAANGAATLATVTASGSAKIVRKASGGATLAVITGSASTKLHRIASAAATLAIATASGASKLHRRASGAAILATAQASGAAKLTHKASGAAILSAAIASGAATVAVVVANLVQRIARFQVKLRKNARLTRTAKRTAKF